MWKFVFPFISLLHGNLSLLISEPHIFNFLTFRQESIKENSEIHRGHQRGSASKSPWWHFVDFFWAKNMPFGFTWWQLDCSTFHFKLWPLSLVGYICGCMVWFIRLSKRYPGGLPRKTWVVTVIREPFIFSVSLTFERKKYWKQISQFFYVFHKALVWSERG